MGLRVLHCLIRNSLQAVDARGVRSRFRSALHQRVYSVPMPNSLWHIDGHHKLIRWRIVIHAGIDGFSRLPVYLKASTNSTSGTVLNHFLGAVASFALRHIDYYHFIIFKSQCKQAIHGYNPYTRSSLLLKNVSITRLHKKKYYSHSVTLRI